MGAFLYHPPPGYSVVITEDKGGTVQEYEDAAMRYTLEGRRVEIRGSCRSACTLALTVPNVCVAKGAVVAWHHAYEPNTNKIRPDVTRRMLLNLPSSIRNRIDGKVQINYSPEATLDYFQLLSLGVTDCDNGPYKSNSINANVAFNKYARNTIDTQPAPVISLKEQKDIEWKNYWNWATSVSASQFGQVNFRYICFDNRECSNNIYYWDNQRNYVTAIEYILDNRVTRRKVCRAEEADADEMTCTDWMTEQTTRYEYDLLSGKYEKVS